MISQRPGWQRSVMIRLTSWQLNVCPVLRGLWSCRLFFLVVLALSSYLPQLDASQFHASIMSLPNENLAGRVISICGSPIRARRWMQHGLRMTEVLTSRSITATQMSERSPKNIGLR